MRRTAQWIMLVVAAMLALPSCSIRMTSTDGYSFDWKGETSERQEEGNIPADVETIEVDNRFGTVHVEAAEDRPTWQWKLTCWSKDVESAERFTSQVQLRVEPRATTQTWALELPAPPVPELRGVRSDLTLRVPPTVQVAVSNGFGDTMIQGISGNATVQSRHGNVQLTGMTGSLDAENSFGSLAVHGVVSAKLTNRHGSTELREASGNVHIEHQHGNVTVEGVAGELHIDNQHGDVSISGVADRAELRMAHGNVKIDGADGDVSVRNRHGDVQLQHVMGAIEVENGHGTIDADIQSVAAVARNEHGRITLHVRNPEVRVVRAETAFADLRVYLPEALSPAVEVDVSHGEIQSEVPVLTAKAGAGNFQSANPHTAHITLKNRHGDIHIKRARPLDL